MKFVIRQEMKQKLTSSTPAAKETCGPLRLHKFLARCGFGSRRRCEDFIRQGRVRVNGVVVQEMGVKVDPSRDKVEFDGKLVDLPQQSSVYFLFHKPRGYITTRRDERGRQTIFDLLRGIKTRVFPVGRLDKESEGLLLLTNDGELAHRLMHPAYRVEKEYWVEVEGELTDEKIERLETGITVDGERFQPVKVRVVQRSRSETRLTMVLREGRKRQIRRMCQAVGHPVRRLIRIREGQICLGDLPPGRYRPLTEEETHQLRHEAGLE